MVALGTDGNLYGVIIVFLSILRDTFCHFHYYFFTRNGIMLHVKLCSPWPCLHPSHQFPGEGIVALVIHEKFPLVSMIFIIKIRGNFLAHHPVVKSPLGMGMNWLMKFRNCSLVTNPHELLRKFLEDHGFMESKKFLSKAAKKAE